MPETGDERLLPRSGPQQRPTRGTGNPATDYAIALLLGLVGCGVRHLIVSPGSRSQALALVAAELERVGAVELHVRTDERVAGFTALGIARESGAPAVVITTSGTATANLHPAVMEASAARVPLIVITSDRPAELRGIRSNQTTDQVGLFGTAVRYSEDVPAPTGSEVEAGAAASLASRAYGAARGGGSGAAGPVQLNLGFREPLSVAVPDLGEALEAVQRGVRSPIPAARIAEPPWEIPAGFGTIVVAGADAGEIAEEFAYEGGFPLIAEVSSGAHFGPNLVVAYRELLRDPDFGGRIGRVVVFGHPTLSREVPQLCARDGVEVLVVDPAGAGGAEFYDPRHRATAVAAVTVRDGSGIDRAWLGSWVSASRRLVEADADADANAGAVEGAVVPGRGQTTSGVERRGASDLRDRADFARRELAAVRAPVTRRALVEAVWRFTWPHDRLVLGASRLIRELDAAVTGKKIRVHANRGLAGIDGTIATAIGVALAASALAPLEDRALDGGVRGGRSAQNTHFAQTPAATPAPRIGTTRVLLGDLTFLHDAGALLRAPGERMPALQVVVGNDGGGTIFDELEVAKTAPSEALERVMRTPRPVDVAALAAAYGWRYRRVTNRGELDQALSEVPTEPTIIEVPLPAAPGQPS